MNEQILKLAQATDMWCDQNYSGDEFYHLRWEEKFAELIVRKCASYMYEYYPHSWYEVNHMRRHMGDPNWNKPIEKEDK